MLGKIIILLALALGAALYFPQSRPVVLDTFAPVINPVLRWQTNGELNQILRELQTILHSLGCELGSEERLTELGVI